MSDLLTNGASALLTFQRALATTSQNIANVNTEGYSRQRVNLESVVSDPNERLQVGSGVTVTNIERMQDEFATAQVLQTTSAYARHQTHLDMAGQIDGFMADDALSLTPALNSFYDAIQDANSDPASLANREIIIEQASSLATRFRGMQQQLDGLQEEVNDRLTASVSDVNDISSSIAEINSKLITRNGVLQRQTANSLLDQRDQLVAELSELADIRTHVQDDGAMNIYAGNGMALVVGADAQQLRIAQDTSTPGQLEIEIDVGNNWQPVGTLLQGGSIGGLRDFERDTLSKAMHEVGRLALVLADSVNEQHKQGIDLQGNNGTDIFSSGDPEVMSSSLNTGSGNVAAIINDVNSLEASDYRIRFDGSGYTTTRISDGQQTVGTLPMTIDGIELSVSGSPSTGDIFIVSPSKRAAAYLENTMTSADALALASSLSATSSIDNTGTARSELSAIPDPQNTNLKNSVEIVFTDPNTFDVLDTSNGSTLATGQSYTSGSAIQYNGWELTINGTASAGDVHRIDAASSNSGSNSNGLALAGLQTALIVSGNQSINDTYGSLVSSIGGQNRSLQTRSLALESLNTNAIERQQSVQGVNLDEEAVNLSRYQQAYQASAQIIATADTLFQTVLNAVGR